MINYAQAATVTPIGLAFDFETRLIEVACQIPRPVCMAWAVVNLVRRPGYVDTYELGDSGVAVANDGLEILRAWLKSPGMLLIGAESAFDILVSIEADNARSIEQGLNPLRADGLLRLWADAQEADRSHDVLLRQQLGDLAAGRMRKNGYALDDVSPIPLDKSDFWRTNYWRLEGLPIEAYPLDAYTYALNDGRGTALGWIKQEAKRYTWAVENFPGMDPFLNQPRQGRKAIALKTMAAIGLRTNAYEIDWLEKNSIGEYTAVRDALVQDGLIRVTCVSDRAFAQAYVDRLEPTIRSMFYTDPTDPARFSINSKACKASGHAALIEFASKGPTAYAAGLIRIDYTKNESACRARVEAAYAKLGKPVPMTEPDNPETAPSTAIDADTCDQSHDPALQRWARHTKLHKILYTTVPKLRDGINGPIHPRYTTLLETGRTSATKGLHQVPRTPGVRECYEPRPGYVYAEGDYGKLELHTLAQTCLWVLGYSKLAEALNAGNDPHTAMAATILGMTYEWCMANIKTAEVDNARTAGKGVNFGAPGGLGPATFEVYAWTNYGIRMTFAEAKALIEQWRATWPEMPDYFRYINSCAANDGETYNIVQPWSGRLRGNATYCSACNTNFQGLGGDVLGEALWLVWKACYGLSELGAADPLYGCRMVLEVHDSIMVEVPEARAHEAAHRLTDLMNIAGKLVTPDVPVSAEPVVMRQWSKKANPWYCDATNGERVRGAELKAAKREGRALRLVPWEMRTAIRDQVGDWRRDNPSGLEPPGRDGKCLDLRGRLVKDSWQPHLIAEVLGDLGALAA